MLTLIGRLGLPVYAAFLVYGALHASAAEPIPAPSTSSLGVVAATSVLVRAAVTRGAWDAARFVPLGLLAALAMPRRQGFFARCFGTVLPAAVVGIVVAAVVVLLQAGAPWTLPGLFELVLPGLGMLFGVWIGMTLTRGVFATLFFLPKLFLLAVLLAVAGGALVWRCLEPSPLSFETPRVSSDEKRRLYRMLRHKNPAELKEGETAELRLDPRDLDLLLAWGLEAGESGGKGHVELGDRQVRYEGSTRVPRLGRYLNVVLRGNAQVENGVVRLRGDALRIGAFDAPASVLRPLTSVVERGLNGDRRIRPLLASVRRLSVEEGRLSVTYSRAHIRDGLVADLFHGGGTGAEDTEALRAQILHFEAATAGPRPPGEARFGAALQSAFAFAAGRSGKDGAVRENRAAILALGILLGSQHLEKLTGHVAEDGTLSKLRAAYRGSTLRGRDDWPKHFTLSAALTVLSLDLASDAVGVLKEELDADHGSGFSFGDLLADRAGTTFADFATRDEDSARALQGRLSNGFRVDDFFPPADGLPEDIQDRDLQARYGGVGGKEYGRLASEIERRIAALPAYN